MKMTTASALLALLIASCTAYKPAPKLPNAANSIKIHVKGAYKSIFHHKIKMGEYGTVTIRSGATKINKKEKRLYPFYYDLTKVFRDISKNYDQTVYNSKSTFRLTFNFDGISIQSVCTEQKEQDKLKNKKNNLGVVLGDKYAFDALIFSNIDRKDTFWKLNFSSCQNISDGPVDRFSNQHNVEGTLTNDSYLIKVKPERTEYYQKDGTAKVNSPFKPLIGYRFNLAGRDIAFVDTYANDVWINRDIDNSLKAILLSASISILIKD